MPLTELGFPVISSRVFVFLLCFCFFSRETLMPQKQANVNPEPSFKDESRREEGCNPLGINKSPGTWCQRALFQSLGLVHFTTGSHAPHLALTSSTPTVGLPLVKKKTPHVIKQRLPPNWQLFRQVYPSHFSKFSTKRMLL